MTKVLFNRNPIPSNSADAYKAFYNHVTGLVNQNRNLQMDVFCRNYSKVAHMFKKEKQIPEFTKLSKALMEFLISKNFYDIASIICSILVKLNRKFENSKLIEDLALRGIAIARRTQDILHIAARANDINHILLNKNPGSEKHLKYLQIQNEALKDICENYDGELINRYKKVNIELAPLENYEARLFHVKLDIARYSFLKDPKYAIYEYEQAKALYEKDKDKYSQQTLSIMEKRLSGFEEKIQKFSRLKGWK